MEIIQVGSDVALPTLPWFAWLGLAAILGGIFSGIVKMLVVHRERMAMIRCGIDPDAPHRKPVYEDADC